MFLPKLLVGGIICFSCGVPVALSLLRVMEDEIKGFVFNKENETTRPILSCGGGEPILNLL